MPHPAGQRRPPRQSADHRFSRYSHAIAPAAGSGALERAMLAALRLRRPQVLGRLAEQMGAQAFAEAMAALSARQMVDALSLLPGPQRAAVWAHLPPAARKRWRTLAAVDNQRGESPQGGGEAPAKRRSLLPRAPAWIWPWRALLARTAGAVAA